MDGIRISVAQLKTRHELTIVNCTSDNQRHMVYFSEPEPAERQIAVWRDVDRAFAQPVEHDEHSADYAPTQVIAEAFREHGLDGIGYRSSLGEGHNVALFDPNVADVISCTVHQVRQMKFDIREVANRYYVTAHYPELDRKDV